jgi:hypothetical protein
MVLCSITIHGLSIPSFSLGRYVHSVSHTWSCHSPPEWLNQAHVVSCGAADIVVNRDRDDKMEHGEIQSDEKVVEPSMQPAMGTDLRDEGSSTTMLEGLEQEDHPPSRTGGERAWPDTLPDGIELVTEWQEPHHRVVEWRTGPGEDVCFVHVLQRPVIDSLLFRSTLKSWTRKIPWALAYHIFDKRLYSC